MIWLCVAALALAESPYVLPQGGATAYGGLGLSTFESGASGLPRDRQLRSRVDLYGAYGILDVLQLSADAPLVHNRVMELGRAPCPTEDDYCDPVTSVGQAGMQLRLRLLARPITATLGLGLRSDAWNASTRGRWTNAGLGTTQGVASAVLGGDAQRLGWVAHAHYARVAGREVEAADGERLPADELLGGLAGRLHVQRSAVELELSGRTRLGGMEFGDAWFDALYPTEDRWAALAYREVAARAKLSLPLGEASGLHVSAGRVILAANGPRDTTDISVGVHRYWGP